MNEMKLERYEDGKRPALGGWTGWLFERLRGARRGPARLAVLERITLAPRQSLALIEAEGRRLLVATSPDGAPAFYALDGSLLSEAQPARRSRRSAAPKTGRLAC
jgi:flagellar biogenesis protein FliO